MFSNPKKSFDLPIYAEAMACASPPTQPSCIPCKYNVDPRVVEYFDIDAIVDASFPTICSNPESNSVSGEIFQQRFLKSRLCNDDSISQFFSCLLMYFLQDWCHSYIHSNLQ